MSEFDGDFKVGDIVAHRSFFRGYHEIIKIERKFITQEDLNLKSRWKFWFEKFNERGFSTNLGDEIPSWIHLKRFTKNNCQRLKRPYDTGEGNDFENLILAKDHIKLVIENHKKRFELARKSLESVMKFAETL